MKRSTNFAKVLVWAAFITVIAVLWHGENALAAVHEYTIHNISITTDDDVLVMTQDTGKYDEVWQKAGIDNASDTLKTFSQMGVIASFYEPSTGLTVNLISNRADSTVDTFSFKGMTDEEVLAYMKSQMNENTTEGMTVSLSVSRDFGEYPFIKIAIDAKGTTTPCSEVIYGTIVNGEMLQFDAFREGTGDVDESFLKKIIGGLKITRELTIEEYEEEVQKARIRLFIILAVFIVLIVLIITLVKALGKRRDAKARKISDEVTEFRKKMSEGKVDTSEAPVYSVTTEYNEDLFGQLGMFLAWIRPEAAFRIAVGIFVVICAYMALSGAYLYALILLVCIIAMLYVHYTGAEKAKDALVKRYDVKSCPKPGFEFYKGYMKITGITGSGEYIYAQITEIRKWQGVIYLFLGGTQVYPIREKDLNGCTFNELKRFISSF